MLECTFPGREADFPNERPRVALGAFVPVAFQAAAAGLAPFSRPDGPAEFSPGCKRGLWNSESGIPS